MLINSLLYHLQFHRVEIIILINFNLLEFKLQMNLFIKQQIKI